MTVRQRRYLFGQPMPEVAMSDIHDESMEWEQATVYVMLWANIKMPPNIFITNNMYMSMCNDKRNFLYSTKIFY